MATLLSVIDFRERFDIDPEILDARITPHIGSASRRLRKWVGEEAYADALLTATTDKDRKEDLQNAEAHLAFHFAIFGLNSPLSTKGVVATSMAGEGKEMRKYLLPDESARLSNMYLELAREIAEPYMIIDSVPESSWEVVPDGLD
ncbi:MAG: hypothetical protein AB7Q00_15935 [Phycisphaerales bacterium]